MANAASLAGHSGVRILDSDGDPIETIDLISNPKDFAGKRAFNTVFGEHVMGWRSDNISTQFQYSNSARDVVATASGSGTNTNEDSMASVRITSEVGDSLLTSRDSVRYRPGHECSAMFTSMYTGAQVGVKQYHGILNTSDGVTFGTQDGVFGVWFISRGVFAFTPQTEFSHDKLDGSGSGFVHDMAKLNLYMVQYGWLGVAPVVYSMYMGHLLGWRVVHTIDTVNTTVLPHLGNPSLPIGMRVVRASGSGSAASISSGSWRAGVIAGEDEVTSAERWFANTQLDISTGGAANTRYNILTLNNKSTYQGKPNHVAWELGIIAFDNSTVHNLAVYGAKNAILTGATAAVDVNTADSVCTYQTGGTVTGGSRGPATILRKDASTRIDVRDTGIFVYPGESFTFEIEASQLFTGTFSMSARWREFF